MHEALAGQYPDLLTTLDHGCDNGRVQREDLSDQSQRAQVSEFRKLLNH